MRRVRSAVEILNEIVPALHVLVHVGTQHLERLRFHAGIVFPPDIPFDRGGMDNELVPGRAARVLARRHQQDSAVSKLGLAAVQGFPNQIGFH